MNRYLTSLTLLLTLCLLCSSCFADRQKSRQLISVSDGFAISLQHVNHPLLLLELKQMHQNLLNQQIKLLSQLSKKSFGLADAIITLVIPGGLIYTINRQYNFIQAKLKLNSLSTDLLLLQDDMVAMNSYSAQSQQLTVTEEDHRTILYLALTD